MATDNTMKKQPDDTPGRDAEEIHGKAAPDKTAPLPEPVETALAALRNGELDAALKTFLAEKEPSFLAHWILFADKNRDTAEKHCDALRREEGPGAAAAYFLAKQLYTLNPEKSLKIFAWCGVGALKTLKKAAYAAGRKDDGAGRRYRPLMEQIAEELDDLPIPSNAGNRVLLDQITHYRIDILASEERLRAAFDEHREAFLEEPEDDDLARSFAWVLHSCIKYAVETLKDPEQAGRFAEELRGLKLSDALREKDPVLAKCRETDLQKAEDFLSGAGEARALLRSGAAAQALALCRKRLKTDPGDIRFLRVLAEIHDKTGHRREALKAHMACVKQRPDDPVLQTAAAWALFRFVRKTLEDAETRPPKPDDQALLGNCLLCLNRLTLLERPSLLYSLLLSWITRAVRKAGRDVRNEFAGRYLRFVEQWGWKNLREEDYQGGGSEKRYASLAENVAGALYRAASAWDRRAGDFRIAACPWALDFFAHLISRSAGGRFAPYYYGRLLIKTGGHDAARALILRTVRDRPDQFWAWKALADTYPDDPEKQAACLCRALACPPRKDEERFLASVREALGDALRKQGMDAEALCEYRRVDRLRADEKWPARIRGKEFGEWARGAAPAAPNNAALYGRLAPLADRIALDGLPRFDGVVLSRYRDPQKNRELLRIWWSGPADPDGRDTALPLPAAWKGIRPGAPVSVWVSEAGGKPRIPHMERRGGAADWDVYPKTAGILLSHDARRGRTYFTTGEGTCTADWRLFPKLGAAAPGGLFDLAVSVRKNGWREVCFFAPKAKGAGLPEFARPFSGDLVVRGPERAFGFAGDVFIPGELLGGLKPGRAVRGIAVLFLNKKTQKEGWRAVTLAPQEEET